MTKNTKLIVATLAIFAGYKLLTAKPKANPAPTGMGGGNTYVPPADFARGSNSFGFQAMGRAAAGSRGDSNGFA